MGNFFITSGLLVDPNNDFTLKAIGLFSLEGVLSSDNMSPDRLTFSSSYQVADVLNKAWSHHNETGQPESTASLLEVPMRMQRRQFGADYTDIMAEYYEKYPSSSETEAMANTAPSYATYLTEIGYTQDIERSLDILTSIPEFAEHAGALRERLSKLSPLQEGEYELRYGFKGNGLTVWNRLDILGGDYANIAHISPNRKVTYYDNTLPDAIKTQIEKVARTSNMTISATQDVPIFTNPAEEISDEQSIDLNRASLARTTENVNHKRSAFYVQECCAVVQRPILISYYNAGMRNSSWPELDVEADMGGELILEMPDLSTFSSGTPHCPGQTSYTSTADVLRVAKEMYGAFLREDYDFAANYIFIAGQYDN